MIRFTIRDGLRFGPVRVPTWKVLLAALAAAGLVLALALLSLALVLVLLPVMLAGLLLRRLGRGRTTRRPAPPGVIEADYVVLPEPRVGPDER